MIEFSFAMKLASLANLREHHMARARRAKRQRFKARILTLAELRAREIEGWRWPLTITITRLGPRKLDSDNLAISAKHVRDGIADALGVDDGDETKAAWLYEQEKSAAYRVRIKIECKST